MTDAAGEHAPFVGDGPKPGETHIVGVAIMFDGRCVSLPKPFRHFHIFALASLLNIRWEEEVSGFMTNEGIFVTREEARAIATACDQPRRYSGALFDEKLYSEDLW